MHVIQSMPIQEMLWQTIAITLHLLCALLTSPPPTINQVALAVEQVFCLL